MKERVEAARLIKPFETHVGSKWRTCEASGMRDECVMCAVVADNGDEFTAWLSWDYATSLENFNMPE